MKHSELRHQPRHVNPRIQVSWDMLFKKSYYATARDELEKNKDSMNELEGIGKNL